MTADRQQRIDDSIARQLRLSMERNAKLARRIYRLRNALAAIQKATTEGRVCDDVAWFDQATTLHDYCELELEADARHS
jgi:hypothetical protein